MLLASVDEPVPAGPKRFDGNTLWHEENLASRDRSIKKNQQLRNFHQLLHIRNHEFQLKWIGVDPLAKDFGLEPGLFVTLNPSGAGELWGGRGIGQFRADRCQIAGNSLRGNGARGLDGDVFAGMFEACSQFVDALGDHRFAAGEDDMGAG